MSYWTEFRDNLVAGVIPAPSTAAAVTANSISAALAPKPALPASLPPTTPDQPPERIGYTKFVWIALAGLAAFLIVKKLR